MRQKAQNHAKKPGVLLAGTPGFLRRLGAIAYDALLLLAVLFLATSLALPFNAGQAFSPDQFVFPVYLLLVGFLFYGWFWTHGGQTLGLRAWKMQLVSFDGKSVSWQQALIRFGAAILSWACLGLGLFWCLFDPQGLCWHDHLSKTRLYKVEREKA